MATIRFEILHPNGQSDSTVIEGETALVGSGSHCDVRLSIDQAPPEVLRFDVQGEVLRAKVSSGAHEVTLDGAPFSGGMLAGRVALGIGRTRLIVVLTTDPKHTSSATARAKSRSVIPALVLTACAVIVYCQFRTGTSKAQGPFFDIELFAAPPAVCPHANREEALAYAAEQLDLANGRRERLPFVAQEGLSAATLYRTSATCYRQAGAAGPAREAEETAQTIERDLTNDFRARCLRLSRMLELEDYEAAQRDVTVLSALAQGKRGRAVAWLKEVTKQLKARGLQ